MMNFSDGTLLSTRGFAQLILMETNFGRQTFPLLIRKYNHIQLKATIQTIYSVN